MDEIKGVYNILFVGQQDYARVGVTGSVVDSSGRFIYLTGPNDVIYNWSNIVIMRKAK